MKKRIFSRLMAMVMALSLLSTVALAEEVPIGDTQEEGTPIEEIPAAEPKEVNFANDFIFVFVGVSGVDQLGITVSEQKEALKEAFGFDPKENISFFSAGSNAWAAIGKIPVKTENPDGTVSYVVENTDGTQINPTSSVAVGFQQDEAGNRTLREGSTPKGLEFVDQELLWKKLDGLVNSDVMSNTAAETSHYVYNTKAGPQAAAADFSNVVTWGLGCGPGASEFNSVPELNVVGKPTWHLTGGIDIANLNYAVEYVLQDESGNTVATLDSMADKGRYKNTFGVAQEDIDSRREAIDLSQYEKEGFTAKLAEEVSVLGGDKLESGGYSAYITLKNENKITVVYKVTYDKIKDEPVIKPVPDPGEGTDPGADPDNEPSGDPGEGTEPEPVPQPDPIPVYDEIYVVFTPDTTIEDEATPLAGLFTRADAIGYLWEQSGSPEAELSTFADVPEDHYWAVAIGWAEDMGIALPDEEGNFRPDDLVLRTSDEPEGELQEFLNRYAVFAGVELEPDELFIELDGAADDIIMGEDAQVIFDAFFAKLETALAGQEKAA